jgi:hypothetical protein
LLKRAINRVIRLKINFQTRTLIKLTERKRERKRSRMYIINLLITSTHTLGCINYDRLSQKCARRQCLRACTARENEIVCISMFGNHCRSANCFFFALLRTDNGRAESCSLAAFENENDQLGREKKRSQTALSTRLISCDHSDRDSVRVTHTHTM